MLADFTSESRSQRPSTRPGELDLGGRQVVLGAQLVGDLEHAFRNAVARQQALRDLGDARTFDLRERRANLLIARILMERLIRHRQCTCAITLAQPAARASGELDGRVRALALTAIDHEATCLDHLDELVVGREALGGERRGDVRGGVTIAGERPRLRLVDQARDASEAGSRTAARRT